MNNNFITRIIAVVNFCDSTVNDYLLFIYVINLSFIQINKLCNDPFLGCSAKNIVYAEKYVVL